MAIHAYTGLPGGGKTYSVVEFVVLPALRTGRRIVTNLPLNLERVRELYPVANVEVIDPALWLAKSAHRSPLDDVRPGDLLIIDEARSTFPQELKPRDIPESLKAFLTEHRHMLDEAGRCVQIVLIAQDLSQLCSFVKSLVEKTFHMTKLTTVGMSKRFRVCVYHGAVTGQKPPKSRRESESYGTYKSSVYELYKSHTRAEGEVSGVDEAALDKRTNALRSPVFLVGAPLVLILGVFGFSGVWGYFHPEAKEKRDPSAKGAAAPSAATSHSVPAVQPIAGRVAGMLVVDGRPELSTVILQLGSRVEMVVYAAARCLPTTYAGQQCEWRGVTYVERFAWAAERAGYAPISPSLASGIPFAPAAEPAK